MASSFSSFRGARQPRRRRHRLLKALLALIVVAVALNVVTTPWVFHIGGRFTPLIQWNGYGPVAGSNGGHYLLFTHLQGGLIFHGYGNGGCGQFSGCDNVQGSAKICTESGVTYTFQLTGQVHAWLSTSGSRTSLDISGGTPRRLPFDIAFDGSWHGPALRVANTDDAFTQAFTARGAIRSTTSTADNGHAEATLRYGSAAGFATACRALAG